MRRLDLRPMEARFDADIAFSFRPLTLPDLIEIVRGTAMEPLLEGGGALDMPTREALEIVLRLIDTLATGWTLADHDGAPLPVTRAATAQLITEEPALLQWFLDAVLLPMMERFALASAEKNASASSPNGTTAGAKTTARRARKSAKSAATS